MDQYKPEQFAYVVPFFHPEKILAQMPGVDAAVT